MNFWYTQPLFYLWYNTSDMDALQLCMKFFQKREKINGHYILTKLIGVEIDITVLCKAPWFCHVFEKEFLYITYKYSCAAPRNRKKLCNHLWLLFFPKVIMTVLGPIWPLKNYMQTHKMDYMPFASVKSIFW